MRVGKSDKKGIRIDPVRGTHDLLPEAAARWAEARAAIRRLLRVYGYGEMVTPVFESADLFRRPLGLGSDVVAKEMYEFKDRGGRDLALRPEGTAPVVRAFVSHGLYARGGRQKFFYTGPIFRYDRPQAGRFRQHHQIGVEAFGDPGAAQDAEVIELGTRILALLNVGGYEIRLNTGGCAGCRPAYEERLRGFAKGKGDLLCQDCSGHRLAHNVMRILDCKSPRCAAETRDAPDIMESLCGECVAHYRSLLGHLDALGLAAVRDPRLFRGFDYYTRTVFEFVDPRAGSPGTLIGGGRYDGLVELLGGPATPAVGFGMGVERVLAASPEASPSLAPVAYVTCASPEQFRRALLLCRELRGAGVACEMAQEGKSLNSQMRAAGSSGARYAMIVGADDARVGLKDLGAGSQEDVSPAEAMRRLAGGGSIA